LAITVARIELAADMRYDGQGYDVTVPLAAHWLLEGDFGRLRAAFEAAHRATYGHANEAAEIWLKELRVRIVGVAPKPRIIPARSPGAEAPIAIPSFYFPAANSGRPLTNAPSCVPASVFRGPRSSIRWTQRTRSRRAGLPRSSGRVRWF
jgi:N-methylhydantoinase A/oxoprolinase/acetone carboxylase beta subunit